MLSPVLQAWSSIKSALHSPVNSQVAPAVAQVDLISQTSHTLPGGDHASLAVMPFTVEPNSERNRPGWLTV